MHDLIVMHRVVRGVPADELREGIYLLGTALARV
jgi:hypothetical protein